MLQSQLTSGPSSIAQEAALAGYVELGNKGGTPVETMRKKFQERRDYVIERLRKIDGIEIETPGCVLRLPRRHETLRWREGRIRRRIWPGQRLGRDV